MFVSFCFCLFSLEFLHASNRSDARTHTNTYIGRDWIILIKHTDPVASFPNPRSHHRSSTFCGQSKNTLIWLIFISSRGARNHAACAPISGRSVVRYKTVARSSASMRNRGFLGRVCIPHQDHPGFFPVVGEIFYCLVAMVSESFLKMQIKRDKNCFYERDCCLIFKLMNIILFLCNFCF